MDTDSPVFQIGLAIFAGLLGWACSYFLPGKKEAGGGSTITTGRISTNGGNVHIGDRVLNLTADNRVYITARAASAMSQPPSSSSSEVDRWERERQQREINELRDRLNRQGSSSSSSSDDDGTFWAVAGFVLLGAFLLVVAIVIAYLQYRAAITTGVELVGTFALAFTLSAIITAALRKVKLSWVLWLEVIVGIGVTGACLYALRWLSNPVATNDRAAFDNLVNNTAPSWGQFGQLLAAAWHDLTPYAWIFYQIMGVALLALALTATLAHTITICAAIVAATRARANPGYVVTPVHRWFMRLGGGPASSFAIALVIAAFALVLVSGLAGTYVASVQKNLEPSTQQQNAEQPTPAPTESGPVFQIPTP